MAPGETLHSIARLYGKSVMVLATANNIRPDTMVKVGERIIIPGVQPGAPLCRARRFRSRRRLGENLATAESPHSARVATPETPAPRKHDQDRGARRGAAELPLAGARPRHRQLRTDANGLQNDGINLAVPEGTPVKAAEDGVVAYAGNELKGYGNLVLVRHSNGFVTAYAHASDILVKRGETVKRGQVIAHSGQTGNVTSPQLHFEIRKGSTPVDPSQYLNGA